MIILGIDPGSLCTGFGLIENQPSRITYIHSGYCKIKGDNLPQRLGQIYQHIEELIGQYQPEQMGIEQVFMHRNADSALKLGQARGAAICAGHMAGLEIAEYAPREIKQAIVGTGAASKEQVQQMVKRLLGLRVIAEQGGLTLGQAAGRAAIFLLLPASPSLIFNLVAANWPVELFQQGPWAFVVMAVGYLYYLLLAALFTNDVARLAEGSQADGEALRHERPTGAAILETRSR